MAVSSTSATPGRACPGKPRAHHPASRYWYRIRFTEEEVRRHRVEVFLHRFERFYRTLGCPEGMVLYRTPGTHDYYFSCGPFEYAGRIYREFPAERMDHPPEGELELVFGEQRC
ncbi:hypothetical protein [Rhodothermus profundi]|uniref:Uncharacterized protein n=1 Tax=Rhodothermus profundi TaxID=633813 RepID=A0A1M6QB64_9BACT|nr:hypothetical protein [Rhodothermus profundi]SHK17482.1 hypothetical protein SAMN04488087_0546 [Rhodothermus profundi]